MENYLETLRAHDNTPFAVIAVDISSGKVIYSNELFLKITAIKSDIINKDIDSILSDYPDFSDVSEFDIIDGNKTRYYKSSSYIDNDIKVIFCNEVSNEKKLRAEIRKFKRELEHKMDKKSSFLASISHEMRTPMQSIYGLLELISEERTNDDVLKMANTAKTSASGLLEILDDVLDLAKLDAGKMTLNNFETPLRTLAKGVLECMEINVVGKNVDLLLEVEQGIPSVIMSDPKILRQILINLLSNAIKFTETGYIKLNITKNLKSLKEPSEGFGLRFEVEDTGIGMPEYVTKKLFSPFSQAGAGTTERYGGTGLGLSICLSFVELMKGEIGVDSVEGKGSRFWFEIPTSEAVEQLNIKLPCLEGISVISVNDHPQGSKEISSSLKSMGAEVDSYSNYKESLIAIKENNYDVAVIDQALPDGLGIGLIKEVTTLKPSMGTIMYTARGDIGLQHTTQVLGATYLTKPASRIGLGEVVKASARQSKQLPNSNNRPKRLLIAEDTESVRDVLKRQLEKIGVDADFVNNGREAIEVLAKGKHGILITDLHMPELDGYGVISKIREQEKNNKSEDRFPVILLTADVHMSQRQAYRPHGFDECLLKPVTIGQLRKLLIRWGVIRFAYIGSSDKKAKKEVLKVEIKEPKEKACDLEGLIELMGEFDNDVVEMLNMFVDMTEPLIAELQFAHNTGNRLEVKDIAHSLKGAANSACCNQLGEYCGELEEIASIDIKINKKYIDQVVLEFARASEQIKAIQILENTNIIEA